MPEDPRHEEEPNFTLAEAERLIPKMKIWMGRLMERKAFLDGIGFDVFRGRYAEGKDPNGYGLYPQAFSEFVGEVQRFSGSGAQIRSIDEGVVGFHARRRSGEAVLLVWHHPEDRIEWWHPLETGYEDRRPILDF